MKSGSHGHVGKHEEEHKAHSEHHHHAGHKGAVVHVHAKAAGGRMEPPEPKAKEDERTKEMVAEEDRGEKRGGSVKGKMTKHRADRRARGGRMTPKEPFSGAGSTPKMSYESKLSHVDMGGKGSEPRP